MDDAGIAIFPTLPLSPPSGVMVRQGWGGAWNEGCSPQPRVGPLQEGHAGGES